MNCFTTNQDKNLSDLKCDVNGAYISILIKLTAEWSKESREKSNGLLVRSYWILRHLVRTDVCRIQKSENSLRNEGFNSPDSSPIFKSNWGHSVHSAISGIRSLPDKHFRMKRPMTPPTLAKVLIWGGWDLQSSVGQCIWSPVQRTIFF